MAQRSSPFLGPVRQLQEEEPPWHHLPGAEVARRLAVDLSLGLATDEIARRRRTYGPNAIDRRAGPPAWLRLLRQLNQPLVYLLLLAIVVTGYLGEWVDCAVIAGVVVVNAGVGFLQEAKAGRAIEALMRMASTTAKVRRAGRDLRVPSAQLVPGDLVLLEAGDRVPADLRLFNLRSLHVDESILTGESLPVQKQADPLPREAALADRLNMAFSGTLVTVGRAEGVVCVTGNRTETGRIARLIGEAVDLETPLTRKIARFSKLLLWAVVVLTLATFGVGVAHGESVVDMFMASVALAVGAIPEGLPAAVTIVLAIGVGRMARRQAIIRRLPAVETLGSTTIICSDKTGTLTQNQMTVRQVVAGGQVFEVTGEGYDPQGEIRFEGRRIQLEQHPALAECLRAGMLSNDSVVLREAGRTEVQGDPTEAALIVAGEKAGLPCARDRERLPRLDSIPFESERMFRATLHATPEGPMIYQVGAVERLVERCADMLGTDGSRQPIDADALHRQVAGMARNGLRVIAMARRAVPPEHHQLQHADIAAGLTFLGLQGMMDPPRPEAIAAVRSCREAGIAVKMITGDHLLTARAIAAQIGLTGAMDELVALSGRELQDISDADLPEIASQTVVFARVAPEQKLRLVRALQARGEVVAMTGDGVNDAPALKQADIGIAMGIGGTDIAKGAAAMVLTDDNFATIQAAVEEGRGVFDNLTKFIVWTLPTNVGEASILFAAIVLGTTLPALPVQLLWINMMTAILLGLMLVFEPKEPGLMQRPPRNPRTPLLTFALIMRTGLVTLVMAIGAFWLFFWELNRSGTTVDGARTAVINVIVMVEIAYLFNCRSLHHACFSRGFFSNPWIFAGALGMLGAQLLFTYLPAMNQWFHTAPIGAGSWLRVTAVAAIIFCIVEFEKWVRFGRHPAGTAESATDSKR